MDTDNSKQTTSDEKPTMSANAQDNTPDYPWTTQHEKILIEWADKAMCFRWLHGKAHSWYAWRNAMYTIPVIIISTLTGTANFAQSRVPIEYQDYFGMAVGGCNLFAGIVTTIQQFLKITQLNEAHRVSAISWDKFYRNIKIEITKHPDERLHVKQLLKSCKEEYDRLIETSPIIPDRIVKLFNKTFKDASGNNYDLIKKPEVCDILIPTEIEKNPWYSLLQLNSQNGARNATDKERLEYKKNEKIVTEFKDLFLKMNFREANNAEIIDNLRDQLDITIIAKIIENQENEFLPV